jgi:hypothetical protein
MAWVNKPIEEYTDGPWGKTIITDVQKPVQGGEDGFAQLMQVQYDPTTGERVADVNVFWNLRDLKQQKKYHEKELAEINGKVAYVQQAIAALPPAPPQP